MDRHAVRARFLIHTELERLRRNKDPAAYVNTGKMTAFVAGFSEVKLRLPTGIPLASGLNIAEAGGDLYARAMILQHEDYAVAILSCDLFGVPGRFVTEVRNIAFSATKHRLDELAIMITATHTHQAPALPKLFPIFPVFESRPLRMKYDNEALTRQLSEQLAAAIIHAWNNRRPAVLKIGSGHLRGDTLHNQRMWDPHAGDPDLEVLTLEVFRDEDQSWILYNIGTLPSSRGWGKNYDADIFGMVSAEIKRRFGNKTISLPLIGAAGNIKPGAPQTLAQKLGVSPYAPSSSIVQSICDGIESGVKQGVLITEDALRVVVKLVSIPIAEPDFAENFPFLHITGDHPNFTLNSQVQAMQIGKVVIVGLPGKPMAAIGRSIKAMGGKLGFKKVLIVSLANDFIGFLFSPESFDAGGYETHFCAHRDAGSIILDAVEEVLEKLKDLEEDSKD